MSEELLLLKDIVRTPDFPSGMHQLRKLIQYGEMKKAGELEKDVNYIIAANIGNGTRKARWAVSVKELKAWISRAHERNSLPYNRNS